MNVGALVFVDSPTEFNRYASITMDASVDKIWTINFNGSDNNGDPVRPKFVFIDNYNNEDSLSYSVDGITSGLAPYTTVELQIGARTSAMTFILSSGTTNLLISEERLPVTVGQKYQQGTGTPVSGTQYMFVLLGSASFVVPATWNSANNKIHCYGAGSDGLDGSGAANTNDGGGAGSYARKSNVVLAPGSIQTCQIGAGNSGVDTWAVAVGTVNGQAATPNSSASAGLGSGDVRYRGGNGGKFSGANAGGGGGAPGIAATGSSPGTSPIGGDSGDGKAGGAAGSGPGVNGDLFTDSSTAAKAAGGSGGGGSIVAGTNGGNAGKYGAGGGGGRGAAGLGGSGGEGIIILEWTP